MGMGNRKENFAVFFRKNDGANCHSDDLIRHFK